MSTGPRPVEVVDVAALVRPGPGSGPVVLWSAGNQLQTNVVALTAGTHIPAHDEPELDVTLTLLDGSLTLTHGPVDRAATAVVQAPAVVVLPAGTRRSLSAGPDGAVYLTAHRRRAGLLPSVRADAAAPRQIR